MKCEFNIGNTKFDIIFKYDKNFKKCMLKSGEPSKLNRGLIKDFAMQKRAANNSRRIFQGNRSNEN